MNSANNAFRLAEVEKRAAEAGFSSLLSPEVGRTVMWFLRRWVVTYLSVQVSYVYVIRYSQKRSPSWRFQESYYAELSLALVSAFGEGTEGAGWTVSFLLEKIMSNLKLLHSEEKLVQDTVLMLVSLVDSREK